MRKPDSLRAALTASVLDAQGKPVFARNPDKLRIYLDKGRVAARAGEAQGFEWRYRCNIVLIDFQGDVDVVALTIMEWIRVNEPALLLNHQSGDQAIAFEADIIDAETVDVQMEIELSEAVAVTPVAGGGFKIEHIGEPLLDSRTADEWIGGGAGHG